MPIARTSIGFTLFLGALSALPPLGIDMSLPALPALVPALGTTSAAAGATLSLFLIGFAVAPLLTGPLADRFGRRPVLLAGVALFAIAGYGCAASPTILCLLLFRLLQGMGAGIGAAMPLAVIRDLFEGVAARTRMSTVIVVLSIAPLVAPILGGAVMTTPLPLAGWRGIYLILGIASTLIWLLSAFAFAESLPDSRKQTLHLGRLLARYRNVLTHRRTLGFAVVNALVFACMFAFISGAPLVLIGGRGFTPPQFAAVFACAGCGTIGGAFLNGWLTRRGLSSARIIPWTLLAGACATLSLLTLSLSGHDDIRLMVPLLMISNATYGLVGPNASHEALVPMAEAAGMAAAVLRAIQMATAASASAVVAALYRSPSSLAMTGVMASCAVTALLVYTVALRRTPVAAGAVA
jgi:DHA1 family bicyclomycin/chloramphenicol resistance-like MFS transporter